MLLAMPTDDRKTLAAHFGPAAEFAVFEIENGAARLVEFRPNRHEHRTTEDERGDVQSHIGDFSGPLKGVGVLICSGFGRRAQGAMEALGIKVVFAPADELENLAGRLARGELVSGESACEHSHNH